MRICEDMCYNDKTGNGHLRVEQTVSTLHRFLPPRNPLRSPAPKELCHVICSSPTCRACLSSSRTCPVLFIVFVRHSYKVIDGGRGYEAGHAPTVKIEAPPFLQDSARATTTLKRSGSVFRVVLRSQGKGYETTPAVSISPPR